MAIAILNMKSNQSLDGAAQSIFRTLGISEYRRHDSDNTPGGIYFKAKADELTLKLYPADDADFEYRYTLSLKAPNGSSVNLEGFVDKIVEKLLRAGYDICRELEGPERLTACQGYSLTSAGGLVKRIEKLSRAN